MARKGSGKPYQMQNAECGMKNQRAQSKGEGRRGEANESKVQNPEPKVGLVFISGLFFAGSTFLAVK